MTTPPPTPRLQFGEWTVSDTTLATTLWANPEVMSYLGGPYTAAEVNARLEREVENARTSGIQYWPVYERESGAFAGACGAKPYDIAQRMFEIGFHFLPSFWGRGYATEASRAVMTFVVERLEITELFAGHHPQNAASRALLERLGFEQIGTHLFERTGLDHPWMRWSQ
jgi:ribosomal-protein-alanine N-acetyltransferase